MKIRVRGVGAKVELKGAPGGQKITIRVIRQPNNKQECTLRGQDRHNTTRSERTMTRSAAQQREGRKTDVEEW